MRHATLRAGLTALVVLALPACSGDAAPGSEAAVSSGDPGTCPGDILDVVVSVGAWADVVRSLGGDCATVTTIAPSADAPAELVPADRASFGAADLVVLNGGGYDDWASDAVADGAGSPVVVSAEQVGGTDAPGRDPHLWYEPAVVEAVAVVVADEMALLSPDAAPYFDAQHTAWTAGLQPWLTSVAELRERATGRTVATTDGVFGRMAGAVGLRDLTPPGYLRAARTGAPSPEDVAALEELLRSGAVDVLVEDGEDEDGVHDRLREAAADADVPVVEVAAAPDGDAPFVEWQLGQLADLAEALADE